MIIWYFNTFTIKTNYEIIESEKIVDEITIIQISDLHGSSFGRNNKELIKKIEKEKPDIICVTGDMYTAKDEKGKQIALKLLQELAKSYRVYKLLVFPPSDLLRFSLEITPFSSSSASVCFIFVAPILVSFESFLILGKH